MPALGESAYISGGDDNSVDARAKRLWFELVQECTRRKIPIRKTPHGDGYLWNGSIQAMAAKVWPHLLGNGRMSTPAQSFVAEIRNHLTSNKNAIFEKTRGQIFISAIYHEPKKKAAKTTQVKATLASTTQEMTTLDRARSVWAKARAHAEQTGCVTEVFENVLFWRVEKPLAYFINAVFPDMHSYEGGRQPIYDFLRSTTNAVNISNDPTIDSEHAWLIRDTWHEGGTVILFRSLSPDRIDQRAARLTPHEAGEDRPAAPVEIRQAEAHNQEEVMTEPTTTEPVADDERFPCPRDDCGYVGRSQNSLNAHRASHRRNPAAPPAPTLGYVTLENGKVRCDECTIVFDDAASIPGHKKVHYNQRRDAEIHRLERENRRLRGRKTSDVNLSREAALQVVQEALEDAIKHQQEIDNLKEQVAKLRGELAEQKQANMRKNAELAELADQATGSGDLAATLDLLGQIVDGVNAGRIGPIRGIADVDDLVRSARETK